MEGGARDGVGKPDGADYFERLKNEFVSTVSHELRTPVTSISGALSLLVADAAGPLPDSAMRLIKIAHANSQRLIRLVNSILDIDKIESGKVVFVLRRVEVRSVIEQAIEANRSFAEASAIRLEFDGASAIGAISADPDWLVQVVVNLLSNAIKFSPPGSEVLVTTERRGGQVRIKVHDHGRGIPEDFKQRVFEKFATADNTDARREGGPGLGLSIVKQIVTRLGGEVGFTDAPGGGTIFHVDLPVWRPHEASIARDSVAARPRAANG